MVVNTCAFVRKHVLELYLSNPIKNGNRTGVVRLNIISTRRGRRKELLAKNTKKKKNTKLRTKNIIFLISELFYTLIVVESKYVLYTCLTVKKKGEE